MEDLQLGPIARVAEALRKSVGPGFELGRWSFFSCRFSPEQCLQRDYYNLLCIYPLNTCLVL